MLTFIILITVLVGFALWFIFDEWNREIPSVLGGLFLFILILCAISLCNRNNRFENIKEQYTNIKMQVDDYNNLPDSLKNVSFEYDLRNNVVEMNNTISKHKVMSKSIWTGPWYSKEVGKLEKLHILPKH